MGLFFFFFFLITTITFWGLFQGLLTSLYIISDHTSMLTNTSPTNLPVSQCTKGVVLWALHRRLLQRHPCDWHGSHCSIYHGLGHSHCWHHSPCCLHLGNAWAHGLHRGISLSLNLQGLVHKVQCAVQSPPLNKVNSETSYTESIQ